MNHNYAQGLNQSPFYHQEIYLNLALKIGRRLCRDAVWDNGNCNWMSDHLATSNGQTVTSFQAVDINLYSGTAGIVFFLQYLYRINQEDIFRQTILGACHHILKNYDTIDDVSGIGYMSGYLGIIDSLIKASEAIEEPELKQKALDFLNQYCEIEPHKDMIDIVSGSAGAIVFLLKMAKQENHSGYLECAKKHGDFLIEQAQKTDKGWNWPLLAVPGQVALTGYSHGASGMAQALAELFVASEDPKYLEAVKMALKWENSWFNPSKQNWPDLREHEEHKSETPGCMNAWCHGAPGIALSRLILARIIPDDLTIRNDLNAAISSTINDIHQISQSPYINYSLCHGLLGNADILMTLGEALNQSGYLEVAYQMGQVGINRIEANDLPWPCGLQGAGELPNLMIGTAGIGLFYLRLYQPGQIESPLLNTSIRLLE